MFSEQLVQNKTGDRDYFLQKKHKIVGKGFTSFLPGCWFESSALLCSWSRLLWSAIWFWWIDKRWNKSGSCCVSFEIWGLQNTPRLWKRLSDFNKKSWAVQCGWNTRWSFVDSTILFFLKNWEVYLFDACRSWSILTILWVSNSFSENYWCFLSWICFFSWFEWLWTNYWCELSEKCSQAEFVWLLWNWRYFRIGWGCSSFGSMNWLNFFLSWCWCSQDLICPSFSLFSFGCFKCVCFLLFLLFVLDLSVQNTTNSFQKQIQFSVPHWSMKREVTQKIHWSEKDSSQSFFNWWMKKSHNKSESNSCRLVKSERSKGCLCACSLCLTFVWFWEIWQKNQDVMIVFGTKTNSGHRLSRKNEFFFVFFVCHLICFTCFFISKQQPLNHPKNHFLCLFWVFCHILQLLSWLFVFCCLRHQNQKKETKQSHDDTHWLAFLILLLFPQKLSQKKRI